MCFLVCGYVLSCNFVDKNRVCTCVYIKTIFSDINDMYVAIIFV